MEQGKIVVVKMGSRGAIAFKNDEKVLKHGFKVRVRSPIGAGDCFNAGFITGVMRGLSLDESLLLANLVGAAKVTCFEGKEINAPTKEQIRNLIRELRLERRLSSKIKQILS